MNLSGDELTKVTTNLIDNLTKEDPISTAINALQSLVKIPDLGGLLGSFSGLLPQNLTKQNSDGSSSLLDKKALTETVNQSVEQLSDTLQSQITSQLDSIMSKTNSLEIPTQLSDVANQTINEVIDSSLSSVTSNSEFLGKTGETFFNVSNIMGGNLTSIAGLQSAANSAINNIIGNLSPKQIRDLADPVFYQQIVNSALESAKNALSSNAIANALDQIAPSLGLGSMAKLAQAGVGLFNTNSDGKVEPYEILVEIHTYYGQGDGADSDAAQKKSVSGKALQSGKSCAVDHSTILLDSKVQTSLGTFTAVDKTKIGSTGGLPVINLYYDTREEATQKDLQLIKAGKKTQVVKVTPAGSGTFKPSVLEKRGTDYELY